MRKKVAQFIVDLRNMFTFCQQKFILKQKLGDRLIIDAQQF